MDNQHRQIAGYRELSLEEVATMNTLKEWEEQLKVPLYEAELRIKAEDDLEAMRWVALARTHLETGFMFAIKAVARPTNGLGRR